MQTKSNPFLLSIISVCLFFVLYLILSFNSRIAADDFYYWGLTKEGGAWYAMLYHYNVFCGRWFAHYIGCGMLNFVENSFFLPFINITTLLALLYAFYISLKKIAFHYKIEITKYSLVLLSSIILCSFFFSCFGIGESWFWYIVILTYMWSIIAGILMINWIFSEDKNIFKITGIIISSAYMGGACESYAVIAILALTILLTYQFRKVKTIKNLIGDNISQKIFIALAFLSISFLITYLSPGTAIRQKLLPQTTFTYKTWTHIKSFVKLFVIYLPPKIPYLILFSSPWLMVGNIFLKPKFEFNSKQSLQIFIKFSIALVILIFILLLPTSLSMSEIGPDRALSLISLLITVFFSFGFTILGATDFKRKKIIQNISIILSSFGIIVLGFHAITEYSTTTKFSKAFDERIVHLNNLKKSNYTGVAELEKLPPEGMLYWDEVSTDTSYYVNQQIKRGLQLQFTIKLKDAHTAN